MYLEWIGEYSVILKLCSSFKKFCYQRKHSTNETEKDSNKKNTLHLLGIHFDYLDSAFQIVEAQTHDHEEKECLLSIKTTVLIKMHID